MFRIKRVYEPPRPDDGCRILVDRLWPRGLAKDAAGLDGWLKDVAPSAELRRWFGHDRRRWDDFSARYRQELKAAERAAALDHLRQAHQAHGVVTLLFAARNETHNHAAVLRQVLNEPR